MVSLSCEEAPSRKRRRLSREGAENAEETPESVCFSSPGLRGPLPARRGILSLTRSGGFGVLMRLSAEGRVLECGGKDFARHTALARRVGVRRNVSRLERAGP